jgi:cholesterol transport system auxiliary component
MTRFGSGWVWMLMALLVGGCAAVGRQPTPIAYRLELDPAAVSQATRKSGILRVAQPEAAAGLDNRGIAYRTKPHQLRYYTKSRWAETPARMLETVLTSAFEASGLFRGVVDDSRLPADYLLMTQLLRLEHHLAPDDRGTVQMRLRLQLLALPERRLLGSRLIDSSAPTPSADAAGAVAAAHAALSRAITETIRFVAEETTQAAAQRSP